MKLNEVGFSDAMVAHLKAHKVIAVNFNSLKHDFETIYCKSFDVLCDLTEEQAISAKDNMFECFCSGAIAGVDSTSSFRCNFNLPKEDMEALNKESFAKSLSI